MKQNIDKSGKELASHRHQRILMVIVNWTDEGQVTK